MVARGSVYQTRRSVETPLHHLNDNHTMASTVSLRLTFRASTFAFPRLRLPALTFASTRLRHFAFAFPGPQRLAMDVRGAAARVQTETRKSVGGGQGSSTNR